MGMEYSPKRKANRQRRARNASRAMPSAGEVVVRNQDGEILRVEPAKIGKGIDRSRRRL